jgi:hypothetical protein
MAAPRPRYYSRDSIVYDREWFPQLKASPPPPFTLARCRNPRVARVLAKTLNQTNVEQFERDLAADAPAFED